MSECTCQGTPGLNTDPNCIVHSRKITVKDLVEVHAKLYEPTTPPCPHCIRLEADLERERKAMKLQRDKLATDLDDAIAAVNRKRKLLERKTAELDIITDERNAALSSCDKLVSNQVADQRTIRVLEKIVNRIADKRDAALVKKKRLLEN